MSTSKLALSGRLVLGAAGLALVFTFALEASAQNRVLFSPDVTAKLGTVVSATVDDHKIAVDDGAGTVLPALAAVTAAIPYNAEIAALDRDEAGNWLLVLDTTTPLPGLPAATPANPLRILRYRPATADFEIALDVVAVNAPGFPPDARIDALAVRTGGNLVISFDTTVAIPGRFTCDDEDLVIYDAPSNSWGLNYDGSAQGIAEGLDLDAVTAPGGLPMVPRISFDGSGVVGGVSFDDEDVLTFEPTTGTYSKYFDGGASDATNWTATDLNVLPEPAASAPLLAGAMALAALARGRGARSCSHRESRGSSC